MNNSHYSPVSAPASEIRVKNATPIRAYLSYIASLFDSKNNTVTVRGTGFAIRKANALAALARRRFKGLHQITDISTVEMGSRQGPGTRRVALVTITLSTNLLDKTNPGYLAPLPDSEVSKYIPFIWRGGVGRGRGRGRGLGAGWRGYQRARYGGRRYGPRYY